MNTNTLSTHTTVRPLLQQLVGWSGLLFGLFFLAGPALQSQAFGLAGIVLAIQGLSVWKAAPLLKELTCDLPRLVLEKEGLGFRDLGEDWFREVSWEHIQSMRREGEWFHLSLLARGEEPASLEIVSLQYLNVSLPLLEARLEKWAYHPADGKFFKVAA